MTEAQNTAEVKVPVDWRRSQISDPGRGSIYDRVAHIYGQGPGGQHVTVARVVQSSARAMDEAEAIMNRIAAADVLYTALRAAIPFLEFAESETSPEPGEDSFQKEVQAALADAHAALAMADGRELDTPLAPIAGPSDGAMARHSIIAHLHRSAEREEATFATPTLIRQSVALALRKMARAIADREDVQRA